MNNYFVEPNFISRSEYSNKNFVSNFTNHIGNTMNDGPNDFSSYYFSTPGQVYDSPRIKLLPTEKTTIYPSEGISLSIDPNPL